MRVAAFFPGNWWPETAIRPEVARTRGTAGGAAPASRGALVSDPGPGVPGETKRGPSARFRRTRGRCHGADVHTSARSLVNRDPSRGATAETPRPCSLEHTKRRNPDRAADARGATRVRPSARPTARRRHGNNGWLAATSVVLAMCLPGIHVSAQSEFQGPATLRVDLSDPAL